MVVCPLLHLFGWSAHLYESLRPTRVFPAIADNALRVHQLLSRDQKECRVSARGTSGGDGILSESRYEEKKQKKWTLLG